MCSHLTINNQSATKESCRGINVKKKIEYVGGRTAIDVAGYYFCVCLLTLNKKDILIY